MTDSDKQDEISRDTLPPALQEKLKDHLTGTSGPLTRRSLLPGIATGQYEQQPVYDKAELREHVMDEIARRDNRISIRVTGRDLSELQKLALAKGIPLQSLIANIVHQYVQDEMAQQALQSKPQVDLNDAKGTRRT